MTEPQNVENRCRLILIVPPMENAVSLLDDALRGGDVASVILPQGGMESGAYQKHVDALTAVAHEKDIAVLVENDSQAMGRGGADGLFVSGDFENLKEMIARFSPKRLVGCGGIKTRHQAMEAGELKPDFLFFGKLDGDIKPEAHPKNLKLGTWCADVMQLSSIVMGGSALESVVEVADSGVEFVALASAVFEHKGGPKAAVARANELLDENAPRFDDE